MRRPEHAHDVAISCPNLANYLEAKPRVQRNTLRCRKYICAAAFRPDGSYPDFRLPRAR